MRIRLKIILPALVGAALLATPALAQLTPDREYYGVNRSIPMTIATPPETGGAIEIVLFDPSTGLETNRAAAARGGVDLAGLFPLLWSAPTPITLDAQLVVGDIKVGSPVVLVPMLSPRTATKTAAQQGQGIQFSPNSNRTYSGIRAYADRHIVFETTAGEVELALRPDMAPNTCQHIMDLVEGGFYTDIKVHRIVKNAGNGHPFVIQFGDPTGFGNGGPGVMIDLEPSTLPHDFGVVSMARTAAPDTNGSQVFLCLSRQGTQFLDGKYTSFGCTVRGDDTLIALENTPTDSNGRASNMPVINNAYTVPAPPFGEGPECVTRPKPKSVDR